MAAPLPRRPSPPLTAILCSSSRNCSARCSSSMPHHNNTSSRPSSASLSSLSPPPTQKYVPPEKGCSNNEDDESFMDRAIFDQLLEMDDDNEREFSKGIVWNYFDQAEETFVKLQTALEDKDLKGLSSLGHFLKGSSAALGLAKVKASCERIQHFGSGKDETGTHSVDNPDLCLNRIKDSLDQVKSEYRQAEAWLKKFYQRG